MVQDTNIVCPKCEGQNIFLLDLNNQSYHNLRCPSCKKEIVVWTTQIRSKRSRGNKKAGTRDFTIRVKNFNNTEDLIEFTNHNYEDIELKSRDLAFFNYYKGELKIIQNVTLNRYTTISKGFCYIATHLYGEEHDNLQILRLYRDTVLLKSVIGVYIVKIYYKLGPLILKSLGNSRIFNMFADKTLEVIVTKLKKRL